MSTNVKTVLFKHKSSNSLAQSFLFYCGLHYSQQGRKVLYISRNRIESLPPSINNKDDTPDPLAFTGIRFLYINSRQKLVEILLGIHSQHQPPTIIIIDQLECFFDNETEASALGALLLHTSRIVNAKTEVPSFVFASEAHSASSAFLHFSSVWSIINLGSQVMLINERSQFSRSNPAALLFSKQERGNLMVDKVMNQPTLSLDLITGDTEIEFY